MALHESAAEAALLQAAADTWLRMTRGADLVLMTDVDDARNASAIAPRLADDQVTVHVVRCAECRGQRCAAGEGECAGVREGWLARRKVLHLFAAMARQFVLDGGGAKHFFLKVDPDTVLVPHNVLHLLAELRSTLGESQPYLFGMAACRVASFPLCHAAGGAGYGLSAPALRQLTQYLHAEYPRFLERIDKFTYGGEDVSVAFALKKQAGITVLNVGCFYQHSPLKYRRLHSKGIDWVHWPLSTTPASFHQIKDPDELRAFFRCALYDETSGGKPRPSPRSLFHNGTTCPGFSAASVSTRRSERASWLREGGVVAI